MEIKTKSNRKTPKIGNRLIVLVKKECMQLESNLVIQHFCTIV